MRLIPYSFNGFYFQRDKISSDWNIPFDWNILGVSADSSQRSAAYPAYSVKNYSQTIKVIRVMMPGRADDRDSLVTAMDVMGGEEHALIAKDEYGRKWQVMAVAVGLNTEATDDTVFGVTFQVADPTWRTVKTYTQTVSVVLYGTGSGTIHPIGNQYSLPKIKITPTGAGTYGFGYKKFINIHNRSTHALVKYPYNIIDGVLDTATLVGAGKMLANGDDLRVFVDGVEVKRWLTGINTANTKVWINHNAIPNANVSLGVALAGAGTPAYLTVAYSAANLANFNRLPTRGLVQIDNEIIAYTSKYQVGTVMRLLGLTRAERQTSIGAHSAAAVIKFIDHDIWLVYGNPTVDAYEVDDTEKPILDMTNSTNTSWVYTEFSDTTKKRTGAWVGKRNASSNLVDNLHLSDIYTATQEASADPATDMGMTIKTFQKLSVWQTEVSNLEWRLFHPCGVTTVTASGNKYRSLTYFGTMQFQKSLNGITWLIVWTEVTPALSSTWTALVAHSAVALSATYNYLRFYQQAVMTGANNVNSYEIGSVTLALDSNKVPLTVVAAEATGFHLHSVITNAKTGYVITVDLPMFLNKTLTIDTKLKVVYLDDGSNQASALLPFPIRSEWFPFEGNQDNTITITDSGIVDYVFEWEAQAL